MGVGDNSSPSQSDEEGSTQDKSSTTGQPNGIKDLNCFKDPLI